MLDQCFSLLYVLNVFQRPNKDESVAKLYTKMGIGVTTIKVDNGW